MPSGVIVRATTLPRGTLAVAAGVGVLGVTSFGYLVVAGRALGPELFGAVAIYWVVLNTLGAGLFLPLEQHVSRELSRSVTAGVDGRRVLSRASRIAAATVVTVVVLATVGRDLIAEAFFSGSMALVLALAVGTAALAVSYIARGRFAGLGAWRRYGCHLAIDGLVRFAGVCMLAVAGADTVEPYVFIVVLGLILSTAVTLPASTRPPVSGHPAATWGEVGRTLGWLLVASVSGLALLNAAPLAVQVLDEHSGASATVGNFMAALTLARIPLFLFSAIQASLLPALSRHVGHGDRASFRATLRGLTVGILALGAVMGGAALFFGPALLSAVFGPAYQVDRLDLALLAVATAGLMLVTTLGQALIAASRYRAAALAPLLGIATFVLCVAAVEGSLPRRVSVALLLAVATTIVALAGQVRVGNRTWAGAADA